MALVTRLSRLFKADFHAVLDRIEEPEALLKHAIREMEDELAASEQQIKRLRHEQEQWAARQSELEASSLELEEQLDVCFASGKDDLARALIRRKLEATRLLKTIAARRESGEKSLREASAANEENRISLASMKQKAELLSEDVSRPRGRYDEDIAWSKVATTVADDEVEVAFLREKQRRMES